MVTGKTDRIDIASFYPFLACIASACRTHSDIGIHPALSHKILNSPNPDTDELPVSLPNGASARLVLLGEKISLMSMGSREWWPTAVSDKVRSKLLRRIVNEGLLLPILLSICISLVSEMYTTTALSADEEPKWQVTGRRRVRLTYGPSPITDFGIVQGSVRVTSRDRLAYCNMDDDEFLMGQDPEDHYRIFIKTLSGDEYFLDLGIFTFNFCIVVQASPYCGYGLPDLDFAPAYFYGKEYANTVVDAKMFKPQKWFSVLRDERVHTLVRSPEVEYCECHDKPTLHAIMDEISGRECSSWEKEIFLKFLPTSVTIVRSNMKAKGYTKFPMEPQIGIETDPGERGIIDDNDEEQEALVKYLTKWAKRLKRGKISQERWEAAFGKWANMPHEARIRMAGPK